MKNFIKRIIPEKYKTFIWKILTPFELVKYGVYKIKEVDAGEVYDVEALNMTQIELKYEEDPLGMLSIEKKRLIPVILMIIFTLRMYRSSLTVNATL